MKIRVKILTIFFAVLLILGITTVTAKSTENKVSDAFFEPEKITAVNDTFYYMSGCGNLGFGGNVIDNDNIPEGITAKIQYVINTENHLISFGKNGNFAYVTEIGYSGTITFRYRISDENNLTNYAEATVYISITSDPDCINDNQDSDGNNDGTRYIDDENSDPYNVDIPDASVSKITFPNPTSGLFSVSIQNYSREIETRIKIYSLNGDLKAEIIPTHSIVDLDLTSFNSGIYVIKIITPNLTCAKKLVLQN